MTTWFYSGFLHLTWFLNTFTIMTVRNRLGSVYGYCIYQWNYPEHVTNCLVHHISAAKLEPYDYSSLNFMLY